MKLGAALVLLLVVTMAGATFAAGDVFLDDVDLAFAKARETGRPLVIDFYTTWCAPCELMKNTTWRAPEVIAALGRCVPLAVDAERAPGLASRYGVDSYPNIIVLAPDGAMAIRFEGMQFPQEMHENLTALLDAWDELSPAATAARGKHGDLEAALVLAEFGREREAWDFSERLYRRILKRRKRMPADAIARAETGLASVYAQTGRCREAERLRPGSAADCRNR